MTRRFFSALASLAPVAAVAGIAMAAVACGDIGLSAMASLPSAGAEIAHSADASADASVAAPAAGGANALATADAGLAPTTVGNPLCFVSYAVDGGVHNCLPDTSSQCAGAIGEDAGAFTGWEDAGATAAGDSGAADAGPVLSACHVVPQGQACTAAGAGGDGAQCQNSADCADSFECVGSPGQCRHYCCGGNAACDQAANVTTGATFCDVQQTAASGTNVPVCSPVTSCTLLLTGTANGSCPKGETCAVVKDDGTTSCVSVGLVPIGGDCDVYHCAADLTCLGPAGSRTCFQLCQVDSPAACPSGTTCTSSAQLFANATVGICQ